jgi:hypothetical protein
MDPQRRGQMIEGVSRRIAGMGMTAPAILFLEMYKPLAFLGAQLLYAFQPLLNVGLDDADLREFALLLENPGAVEQLIDRLASTKAEQPSATLHQRT